VTGRTIRILELRSVRGTGGGPEKTILLGAAQANHDQVDVTVCYIRDRRDRQFRLDERAAALGVDYLEVHERHSFDPSVWPALRRIVRDRQIDIVHAHEYKTDLLALMLSEFERVIPLATVHGWTGHSRRERSLYYPIDRRLLTRYPRLIAVSGEIRQQLVASGARPDRVTVVLNGINAEQFNRQLERNTTARAALGFEPRHTVIGAIGRLEPQKRFDVLIEATAEVHRDRPDVRLVIAGEGSTRAALADLAARRLPPGVCRMLGHCDDVAAVHHGIDVFVQSSDYEGTPNAVLEAMAFQSPIVATDVGGTAEIARHGEHALIVPPRDSAALAQAIRTLLADPVAAHRRAAAARRRVEGELSFSNRMRTVERIYADLVAEGRQVRRSGFFQWA
jgi:glycosyltransferase involved in cell wall biosynthesis